METELSASCSHRAIRVLAVSWSDEDCSAWRARDEAGRHLLLSCGRDEATSVLERGEADALVLGTGLSGAEARRWLEGLFERVPALSCPVILTHAGPAAEEFQALVDADRLFYLTPSPLPPSQLLSLVCAAAGRDASSDGLAPLDARAAAEAAQRLLLQGEAGEAALLAGQKLAALLAADRGSCRLFDHRRDVLWSLQSARGARVEDSAVTGLGGFVARTGEPARVERSRGDARYDREVDDPAGAGEERLLACAVRGPRRQVLAVLAAVRGADRPPFSSEELALAEYFAALIAPTLDILLLRESASPGTTESGPYREAALNAQRAGKQSVGEPLRAPRWSQGRTWLLALAVALTAALLGLVRIESYAVGPAVVREEGGRPVVHAVLARAKLSTSAPARLRAAGISRPVRLEWIDEAPLGREEARRRLSPEHDEAPLPPGELMFVRAAFTAPGPGLPSGPARLEVALGARPLLFAVFPRPGGEGERR